MTEPTARPNCPHRRAACIARPAASYARFGCGMREERLCSARMRSASVPLEPSPLAPAVPACLCTLPFGATGETADLTSLSELSQITLRVLLVGVERLVGGIAARLDKLGLTRRRCHVLLPRLFQFGERLQRLSCLFRHHLGRTTVRLLGKTVR